MITIRKLLDRVRWDAEFAKSEFEIGYFDRQSNGLIRVPLQSAAFRQEDHFAFEVVDSEGESHRVPYHRIKQVFRDGELIWQRTQ